MSVPVSYSQNNDRFVRHSFLSLSPTSTTIFQRTFDLFKNKYHVPLRVKEVIDLETGEINEVQEEIKPPVFKEHIGTLSDKARRQLNRSVYTLLGLVDDRILVDGTGREKITFCTLTLPSPQIRSISNDIIDYYATDKEIKSACFNQLLTELRQNNQIKNYVWVSEKQLNGSIHFHILFDSRIDYKLIRSRWNSLLNKFGFIDRYQKKMQLLTKEEYTKTRLKENWSDKLTQSEINKKIENAWNYGIKTHWTDPNSTDIETLKHVDNVAAYISKYMSKSYSHTNEQQKQAIYQYTTENEVSGHLAQQFYKIDGRIWQCSQTVSKARKCIIECEDTMSEAISNVIEKVKDIKIFTEDRFTTVLHHFKHIKTYAYEIYQTLIDNYKAHIQHDIIDFLNRDYTCNSVSVLSPLLVQKDTCPPISETPLELQQQINFALC